MAAFALRSRAHSQQETSPHWTTDLRFVSRSNNNSIERRQISQAGINVIIILAVSFGVFLCGGLIAFFTLRFMRARGFKPTYIPGRKLKAKWNEWRPNSATARYSTSLQGRARPSSVVMGYATPQRSSRHIDQPITSPTPPTNAAESTSAATRADRHVSVRSIITLPAYSLDARETEEVLGREGERAGIDTVLEFPETQDEEESRREEEMESLFQIRQARRAERAQREERRRLRREARERNDTRALEALRQQQRETAQSTTSLNRQELNSSALIQEHQSKDRGRKIPEVNYGKVGVARHDGSRVRADSGTSDNAPLLDSAASMGGRSRSESRSTFHFRAHHLRNQSSSSLRLVTTDVSDDGRPSSEFDVPPPPVPAGYTSASSTRLATSMSNYEDQDLTLNEPPQYDPTNSEPLGEQAPPYESPIDTAPPSTLSGIPHLPAIQITPFSPIVSDDGASESTHRQEDPTSPSISSS